MFEEGFVVADDDVGCPRALTCLVEMTLSSELAVFAFAVIVGAGDFVFEILRDADRQFEKVTCLGLFGPALDHSE